MGMNAELIAVGPFDEKIEDLVEYNERPDGKETVICIFYCPTSSQSRDLAEACRLSKPYQNSSVESDIEWGLLDRAIDEEVEQAKISHQILKRFGFKFYYIANR